jgi:hypothetical protein
MVHHGCPAVHAVTPPTTLFCRMVLKLYRDIVRTHRNVLPPPLRAMGDIYARDEFRRHWKPQTTKSQWQAFVQEWQRYLSMLQGRADLEEQRGDIPENVLESLSAEQKAQLARLKEEALRAREAILSYKPEGL